MAYGRKLKGTSRRVPITVHTPLDRLDAIDEYVEERRQQEEKHTAALIFTRRQPPCISKSWEEGKQNDVYQNCTGNFESQKNHK